MAESTDKELAVEYRLTFTPACDGGGFRGSEGEENFSCRCDGFIVHAASGD